MESHLEGFEFAREPALYEPRYVGLTERSWRVLPGMETLSVLVTRGATPLKVW